MSLVCWNIKVFLQCGLSPGKRRTHLLMICWGLKWYVKVIKKKKKKKKHLNCLPAKSGPRILKCLQPHIPMCICSWSYSKALCHSIHDVSLSIWVRIVYKISGQNTLEKTLHANLLKKNFHRKIFIRLSAII